MTEQEAQQLEEWCFRGQPDPAPPFFKPNFVTHLAKTAGVKIIVETGTFYGDTTAKLADLGAQVHTIELSEKYYQKSVARFSDYPNVICHHGSSPVVLSELVQIIHHPALFFLDGHFSGSNTARGKRICPALEELFALCTNLDDNAHFVLIDDIRLFDGKDYPDLKLICDYISYYWPRSQQTVAHDMLYVVPEHFTSLPKGAAVRSRPPT